MPMNGAAEKKPTARGSRSAEKQSDRVDVAAGPRVASPTPTERRHDTPADDPDRHEPAPVVTIGDPTRGQRQKAVEQGERKTHDERYLGVGDAPQVSLHGAYHHVQNLPVDDR